jgi:hypothetical protein
LVCTGIEVNDYLAGKGFAHTRVEPLPADPHRMFLGDTTAREAHTLLGKADLLVLRRPAGPRRQLRRYQPVGGGAGQARTVHVRPGFRARRLGGERGSDRLTGRAADPGTVGECGHHP